jgi:hypothetical protein
LKKTESKFLEPKRKKIKVKNRDILTIPTGFFHLFFPDESLNLRINESCGLNLNQISHGANFLIQFSHCLFSIPDDIQVQYLSLL